jgi:hypothetical protein
MKAAFIALIFAIGSSVWIYTKLQDRTGHGNNTAAFKGAAISFSGIFIVVFTVFLMVFHGN